jgi:glycosyltransferase involved in cell wall biosynthesis
MDRPVYRILILNSCRKWIGEAAHTFDLRRELSRRGHQVLLGCRRGRALEEAARREGFEPLCLEFQSRFSPWRDLRDVQQVRRTVRRERIDIVHCHRGKDHWVAATALLGLKNPPALVRTRHVVTSARNHALNRRLYGRETDALIAVSQKALSGMGDLLKVVPPERARVILSAVDLERFNPARRSQARRDELGVGPDDLLVGLVGRYQNIKGQRVFLRAAGLLARRFPKARFLTAGRGSRARIERFRGRVADAGLEERFAVLDFQEDLPSLLASLDVGVVASLGSEGSSRVGLEYMASGAPVVATRVGALPELLGRCEHGLLAEPGDESSLAEEIARVLKHDGRREQLRLQGRARVEERHTYERWVREIEEVYAAALERNL